MKQIRVIVIGCGDLAHIRYFYALPKLTDIFQLKGVYDYNPAVCAKTAEEFNVKAYETLEDALAADDVDAAIIATFHPSHAEIAIKAMKGHMPSSNIILSRCISLFMKICKKLILL